MIGAEIGFVTLAAIRHGMEIGCSVDWLKKIELAGGIELARMDAIFADKPGAVARIAQKHRVARLGDGGGDGWLAKGIAMGALGHTGENRGPARHTNRGRDEGILEAHALLGQGIKNRSLENGVPGCAESITAVIIAEKEDDIGLGISIRILRGELTGCELARCE